MSFIKSLRIKVLLSALVPFTLVIVVVALIVLYTYERVARNVVEQRDAEFAKITAARLSEGLSLRSQVLNNLAADDDVQSMEPARLRRALEAVQDQLFVFAAGVVVYDRERVAVWSDLFAFERRGKAFPIPSEFESVRNSSQAHFSDVFMDNLSGEHAVLSGVPIVASGGEFMGVLVGLDTLRSLVSDATYSSVLQIAAGREGFAYLVDGNGRVIYHPDDSQLAEDLSSVAPVTRAIRGEASAVIAENSGGATVISGPAPVPGTNWGVVTEERWSSVVGPIRRNSMLLLGLILGGGFVSGALVLFTIRRVLKPVGELNLGAQRIASGDFDHAIAVRTGDEIQDLAEQFNTMAGALKESYAELEQRARELTKLEELGRAILNGPPDASTLSELLGEHVSLMFPHGQLEIRLFPDQILLRHPDDRQPVAASAWEWLATQSEAQHFLPGEVPPWDTQAAAEALVVAPILAMETKEPIGGIHLSLGSDPDAAPSLLPAVNSLAAQICSALHGARVYAQELAHESVSRELALAGQVQANFLPDTLPDVPGWQLAAMLEPARETSGDFYDVIPLPSGRFGLLIADVADKGMGAALYMALSRTLIRTYAIEHEAQPGLVLAAANHRILADTRAGLFVTVFYGVLDPTSGELTYSNAGHNPPYLLSAGDGNVIQELDRTGVPLGILDDGTWQQRTAHLAPGDVLLLYTDGITEAQNAQEAFFDEDGLREVVRANLGRSARDIQDGVIAQVGAFVGDTPQFDDITMMVVVRLSTQAD